MSGSIGDVEVRLLRVFVTVARHQGLAAAQHELNLSLPTISAHVARLEERLGLRLCERGRSGFRLTDEGKRVVELAQSLIGAVEDFSSEVGALKQRLRGSLRIAIIDNVANNPNCCLPDAIAEFESRYDDVDINVELVAPNALESAVSDGRFHLGIGPVMKQLPSLDYHYLFGETQQLYCAAGHPLFERANRGEGTGDVEEADLARTKYVAHLFPIPQFQALGEPLPVAAKSQYMESVAVMILSGRYVGFLPTNYAADWVRNDMMRPLRPQDYSYTNAFFAVTRKHRQPTRVLSVFHDILARSHNATPTVVSSA